MRPREPARSQHYRLTIQMEQAPFVEPLPSSFLGAPPKEDVSPAEPEFSMGNFLVGAFVLAALFIAVVLALKFVL